MLAPESTYTVLLLSMGVLVALFEFLGRESKVARAAAAGICIALTLRYMHWRFVYAMPVHQNVLQQLYSRVYIGFEVAAMLSSMLVYFFMSRTLDRRTEADAHAASPLRGAPTDVFIATYNESYDILERTAVGALALDHPDLRVWLLDDGARPWVKELAESLGIHYVSRVKGKHAKAGNINNGMQHALATGRKPQFMLLLDADFVPHRHLLQRVLGLFDTADVGIVQTPQHFFNADPVQSNLVCASVWPDEQRFFFNCLLPSKDAWGAAFCCGTSAVIRVDAFQKAGGMATQTVTEDMLTTFQFDEHGYRTVFLNERLSLGLAPESMVDFISQRSRWCLGAVQQIFTPWSFFGRRMSWINRLAFFDSVLFWIAGAPFKILLLSTPMLYWWTGTTVMNATGPELLAWAGPMILCNVLFMAYVAGNRILPIMTDATQMLTSFVICRTVATALVRPFGRPFKVTAKGISTTGVTVQWAMLWKFAALGMLTLLGMFAHLSRFDPAHGKEGYATNILWSLLSAAVFSLAAMACIELPHRRRDERFQTDEHATVRIGETDVPCRVRDISLGGAAVVWGSAPAAGGHDPWNTLAGPAALVVGDGEGAHLHLPCDVMQSRGALLTVRFHPDTWIRHALIRKLFTGGYHQEVAAISTGKVFRSVARAAFS